MALDTNTPMMTTFEVATPKEVTSMTAEVTPNLEDATPTTPEEAMPKTSEEGMPWTLEGPKSQISRKLTSKKKTSEEALLMTLSKSQISRELTSK